MSKLLAFSLAILLCGQVLADGYPAREWTKIAVPGPLGNYHVWGWRQGDKVLYFEAEQPTREAGQPSSTLFAHQQTATPMNYGVEVNKLREQRPGVFETNDVAFDGSKFFGDQQRRESIESSASAPLQIPWLYVLLALGGGFFLLIGILKRLE